MILFCFASLYFILFSFILYYFMQVYSFHDFIVKEVTMTEDLKIVEYIKTK